MDPRTGRPVQGLLAVAVLTETGTNGHALDDGLFVLGVEGSRSYRARLRGRRSSSSCLSRQAAGRWSGYRRKETHRGPTNVSAVARRWRR